MGFSFGGTQANVTLSGGLTVTKATALSLYGTANGISTVTLGTVPANKIWRIVGAQMSAIVVTNASSSLCKIKAGGVELLVLCPYATATTVALMSTSNAWDITAAPVLVATNTVTLESAGANGLTHGTVQYVEESV